MSNETTGGTTSNQDTYSHSDSETDMSWVSTDDISFDLSTEQPDHKDNNEKKTNSIFFEPKPKNKSGEPSKEEKNCCLIM